MKIGWTALGLPLCSRPLRASRRRRLPASRNQELKFPLIAMPLMLRSTISESLSEGLTRYLHLVKLNKHTSLE